MTYEVEQKFRVKDLTITERALLNLGADIHDPVTQADTYFSHPAREFQKTDEILRLRSDGNDNFITYKGPRIDKQTKTRVELELPLPTGQESAEQFRRLLSILGFDTLLDVRKRRKKTRVDWQGCTFEVALDEVDVLGTFVELETLIDEDSVLDAAKQRLTSLASELGLTENEVRSYSEIMWEAKAAQPASS